MKKLLIILLLIPLSMQIFAGDEKLDLFRAGNEAYAEGKYEDALTYYKQIVDQGFESADLYFNMGNATFRSNRLGYAVLYYNKALKLDPGHEEAGKNLEYVSLYLEDSLDSVPQFFLKVWLEKLFSIVSLKVWSVISLALFSLFLLSLLIYIFVNRLGFKKAGFFSALFTLILFIVSFSATLNRNSELKHPDTAVIVSPSVVVKSSPSSSGTDLFVLHEGTDVTIDETVGEWIEIRISDGRIGWLEKKSIEII